jgi:hypothetical protein
MFALIDSDFNQNFIDQRFAYKWRLKSNENLSTNSQTMNNTFLRVFRSHLLEFSSKKKRRKNFQNQTEFNVNSHDEWWRYFENVLIEKDEFSNELSDKQMTISKEFKHVIE